MLRFQSDMVENTLKKINSIEKKAEEIIKKARESSTLTLIKTREDQKQALRDLEEQLIKDQEDQVRAAGEAAAVEAKKILAASQKQVKEINKMPKTRLARAKKEILRCLS